MSNPGIHQGNHHQENHPVIPSPLQQGNPQKPKHTSNNRQIVSPTIPQQDHQHSHQPTPTGRQAEKQHCRNHTPNANRADSGLEPPHRPAASRLRLVGKYNRPGTTADTVIPGRIRHGGAQRVNAPTVFLPRRTNATRPHRKSSSPRR